jgi:cellobiose-specific phosphotransferase system component IIA
MTNEMRIIYAKINSSGFEALSVEEWQMYYNEEVAEANARLAQAHKVHADYIQKLNNLNHIRINQQNAEHTETI